MELPRSCLRDIWLRTLLFAGLVGLPTALPAEDPTYCAFEVKVSTPSGAPLPNVLVAILRKGGEHDTLFAQTATDADGIARLCDAALEVVDIGVGKDVCVLVVVKNLQPAWPDTRRVYVTFSDAPCEHFVIPRDCRILLRIYDEEGRALSGARFEGKPSGGRGPRTSEVFGRLYRLLKRPGTPEGVVAKGGHEPTRISVECDREEKVVLHQRRQYRSRTSPRLKQPPRLRA